MPAKSRGKKHYTQNKNTAVPATPGAGVSQANGPTVATAEKPAAKPNPVLSTQPEPRRNYVGKELIRVGIISVIVLTILIVLAIVLR